MNRNFRIRNVAPVLALSAVFCGCEPPKQTDPDRIEIVSGDNQTVPIDTLSPPDSPLNRGRQPNPLVVQVLDDFGNPVQGVAVQWRVSDGGGAMFSFTTFSDPLGFATNAYTGVTEGANAIIAIAAGTQAVQFDITGKVIVDPEEDTGDDGDGGGGGGGG